MLLFSVYYLGKIIQNELTTSVHYINGTGHVGLLILGKRSLKLTSLERKVMRQPLFETMYIQSTLYVLNCFFPDFLFKPQEVHSLCWNHHQHHHSGRFDPNSFQELGLFYYKELHIWHMYTVLISVRLYDR